MKTVLKKFIDESLFDACSALLHHLHIVFNEVTRVPVPFEDLYPLDLSKALDDVLAKVEYTYFIGTVDELEPDKDRVRVVVSMFGRETPVDLELDQVEVIKD